MFRSTYQKGSFFTVFHAIGQNPLGLWKCKLTRDSHCKRIIDDGKLNKKSYFQCNCLLVIWFWWVVFHLSVDLKSSALELLSTNVTTCFISTPIAPYRSLAIKMAFITIILKNLEKSFTFEIEIRDHEVRFFSPLRYDWVVNSVHQIRCFFLFWLKMYVGFFIDVHRINCDAFKHQLFNRRLATICSVRRCHCGWIQVGIKSKLI